MKKIKNVASLLFLVISLLPLSETMAQGNLLVTPKRVMFEGSARAEILNLSNAGSDTATYQISFIQIRMRQDGSFENINEPDSGQQFADKNIRFFPRTVTLAPNEAQTVKLQLIKSDQLQTGEYRSHLYMRAIPKERPRGDSGVGQAGIAVKIVPVFGISIPVIIRVGQTQAQASIAEAKVINNDQPNPVLKMSVLRSGNQSLYGDIAIEYMPVEGKTIAVSTTKVIALYTPNKLREIHLPLDKKLDYTRGKLHVVYYDQSGKNQKLAETYVSLN